MFHSLQEKLLGKKHQHEENASEAEKVKEAAKEATSMYSDQAKDAAKEAADKAKEAINAKQTQWNKGMEEMSERMKEKGDDSVLSMKKGADRVSEGTHSFGEKAKEWMHSAQHRMELMGAPLHQAGLIDERELGSPEGSAHRIKEAAQQRVDELSSSVEKGSEQIKESADRMKEKAMAEGKHVKEKLSDTIHSAASQTSDVLGGGAGTSDRVARLYQIPQEATTTPSLVDVTASGTTSSNIAKEGDNPTKGSVDDKTIPPY